MSGENTQETQRWLNYFMDVAERTARLSYAEKLKVGAVAVINRRIICTGYNGTPAGCDNTCEKIVCENGVQVLKTLPEVEHAERNLIYYAAKHGIALNGASLFITHSPCLVCARAILLAGFVSVVCRAVHKKGEGLDFLNYHNIKTSFV